MEVRRFQDQVGRTAFRACQRSLLCQVGWERRCQYGAHGYRTPQHPVCVHSRVITPVINYKPRLGSHFPRKWIRGFRTSIWVGLIHPSSSPGLLPQGSGLRGPTGSTALLSAPRSSLLGRAQPGGREVETRPSEGDRPGLAPAGPAGAPAASSTRWESVALLQAMK